MVCDTLVEILKGCDNAIGGVKKIEVRSFGSSDAYIVIEFPKEGASFSEVFAADISTGNSFVTQTLTVNVPKRDATKANSIKILGAGQRDLDIKVTDNTGGIAFMGVTRGANLIKADSNTGSKLGDANGYILTFEAKEPDFAVFD